jgi:formylglycine-generating enzyme required for sulfatase activity
MIVRTPEPGALDGLPLEQQGMRVYLSSTLSDLEDERRAVKDALSGDYTVVESYEADPRPLWQSCIGDVASCAIHIGIVGMRYGFVPPGQEKSITELEFDAARAAGLPCFMFVRKVGAVLTSFTDLFTRENDPQRIEAFRARLSSGENDIPRAAQFTTADDLRIKVLRALHRQALHRQAPAATSEPIVESPLPKPKPVAAPAMTELQKLYRYLQDNWETLRTQQAFPPIPGGRPDYPPAPPQRPLWAKDLARDGQGLYLDVDFAGVVQRFRWIEPGEFMMGSPADEPQRNDDEGPRHRVRLSKGLWLADTACTQALWRAVMGGKNPSFFQGDVRNPVEQVSWDDVRHFLEHVSARLPGVVADLPTEAEWEYACRAGSETPFSFGATISPEQANYDGNYPCAGGRKGQDRQKTVAVKSFAPNDWGLYEMHGNVWEWCADGRREYDVEMHEDPRGPESRAPRVVRGGSWSNHAWWLRSAFRRAWHRGYRFDCLGFRFSLRSTSQ